MIFDVALQLPDHTFRFNDRPLAEGMRASIACDCPACAVIQYLDPNDSRFGDFVDLGVATLGHALHQMWAWQSFSGERYEVEASIPWAHGVSHDDVIVHTGPWVGLYECKTHSEKQPKSPSAANYRQAEFRLRLRELTGLPIPGPMRLVMIGKAGREGGMVRGPWEVFLTDERRAEIDVQLAQIDSLMTRAADIDLHADEQLKAASNGCTRCFPKPTIAAKGEVSGLLGRYVTLKRELDEVDAKRKLHADAKKDLQAQLDELRASIDVQVPKGVVVQGMSATATRNRAGSLTITAA